MSSVVPLKIKKLMNKAYKPRSFNDVNKSVQFIARHCSIILGECILSGSHSEGLAANDSDIDISVDREITEEERHKIKQLSNLYNTKIDLSRNKKGFRVPCVIATTN